MNVVVDVALIAACTLTYLTIAVAIGRWIKAGRREP